MAGSHVALGAAAWLVASPHLGLGQADPAGIGLAATASLLPDIDHPKSWVGSRLRPISDLISAVFGHRGITHSALAVAACAFVLFQGGAPRWAADAVAVGYASHLAADLLTPNGLRLAWPMRRTWALPLCKSGSQAEPLVVAALVWWAASGVFLPPPLQQAWQWLHQPAAHIAHRTEPAIPARWSRTADGAKPVHSLPPRKALCERGLSRGILVDWSA
ncbi:MAG TPA: metal-dependent hydrolase, partial [Rhodopila sp.]|nr:metal-dependent hydrolase [Rhodopila sp.]